MPEILPNWHPIVVHFAIGLLLTAVVLFVIGSLLARLPAGATTTAAARLNLGLGVAAALVALATGWQADNSVAHDAPSHANMTIHMKWAITTAAVFVFALFVAWLDRRRAAGAGPVLLVTLVIGSSALAVTGWLGGENVYRFGLGVLSIPKSDGPLHGAGHEHAGHDDDDDHVNGHQDHEFEPAHGSDADAQTGLAGQPHHHDDNLAPAGSSPAKTR